MFTIVIFEDENCVEGVPSSWVKKINNKTYCLWPNKDIKIRQYVKSECKPKDNWLKYKCRVKCQVENYEQMLRKVAEAETYTTTAEISSESSLSSTDSDTDNSEVSVPTPPAKKAKLCKYFSQVIQTFNTF